MAGETTVTVVGNLTDDPELRFTPSGAAVAKFRVASTPRTFDRQTGEWKDGEPLFLQLHRLAAGGRERRRVAAAGTRVIVQGRLRQRSYETREGEKRTVFELEVDEIGPSLRYATAKVTEDALSPGGEVAAAASVAAVAATRAAARRRPGCRPAATTPGRPRRARRRRPGRPAERPVGSQGGSSMRRATVLIGPGVTSATASDHSGIVPGSGQEESTTMATASCASRRRR